MAKPKNKPVELWPEFDTQLPRALNDEARKNFTLENIEAARETLNPPADFDLIGRLRLAVFNYFCLKSGRMGDNAALRDLMPAGAQKNELDDLIKNASALLSICEKKPELIANIVKEYEDRDGLSSAWDFSQRMTAHLKQLKQMAEDKRSKLKPGSGNKDDIARRVFCGHLLMIYEDATGRQATTTKAGKAHNTGPAHNFFSTCWSCFINSKISDDSTLNYLKDAIDHRDAIKASHLFK